MAIPNPAISGTAVKHQELRNAKLGVLKSASPDPPVATVPVHSWRGTEKPVGTDIETSIDGILRNLGSKHRLSRSGFI